MLCQCGWISLYLHAYWFDLLLIACLFFLCAPQVIVGVDLVFFYSYDFHVIIFLLHLLFLIWQRWWRCRQAAWLPSTLNKQISILLYCAWLRGGKKSSMWTHREIPKWFSHQNHSMLCVSFVRSYFTGFAEKEL